MKGVFLIFFMFGYHDLGQNVDYVFYTQQSCQTDEEWERCGKLHDYYDSLVGEYYRDGKVDTYWLTAQDLPDDSISFVFEWKDGDVLQDTRPAAIRYDDPEFWSWDDSPEIQ